MLVIPLGMASYAVWCWLAFGDPLYFLHGPVHVGTRAERCRGRARWAPSRRSAAAIDGNGAIFQPIVVFNVIDLLAVVVTGMLLVLSVVGPWRLGRESRVPRRHGRRSGSW